MYITKYINICSTKMQINSYIQLYSAFLIYFDINQKIILLRKKQKTNKISNVPQIFVAISEKLNFNICHEFKITMTILWDSTQGYCLFDYKYLFVNFNNDKCQFPHVHFFRNDLPLTLKVQIIIYSFFLHAPPIFYKFCSFF